MSRCVSPRPAGISSASITRGAGICRPATSRLQPRSNRLSNCHHAAFKIATKAGTDTPGADSSNGDGSADGGSSSGRGFDLSVAVALAAAAFEAYLEPTGGEGFEEVTLNSTHISYTSRQYLSQAFDGVLRLTIRSASGLREANPMPQLIGPSDPYVLATIGDSSGRTSVKWGTVNPVWGETFNLYVSDVESDILRLRVYDKNNLISDADLGVAMLPVKAFGLEGREMTADVKGAAAQGGGQIVVHGTFLPFAQDDTASEFAAEGGKVAPQPEGEEAGEAVQQQLQETLDSAKAAAELALEEAKGQVEQQLRESGADAKEVQSASAALQAAAEDAATQVSAVAGVAQRVLAEAAESGRLGALPVGELASILARISGGGGLGPEAAVGGGGAGAVQGLDAAALPGAWRALADVAGKSVDEVFKPVAFLDNRETDTQVWLYRSALHREVVVAFRGTEQVKWKDFVSDMNLIPTTLDEERSGGISLGVTVSLMGMRRDELMVHSGFLSAYDSVRPKLLKLVDSLASDMEGDADGSAGGAGAPWRVYVTGHSLGGALATLCAYELAGRRPAKSGHQQVIMYTYGAPRVGNAAFAAAFNARLAGRAWRITNHADIVPSVPRLMGYAHVGGGIRLTGGGGLLMDPGTADVLGEGREALDVLQDLASQALEVAQGSRTLESITDAIKDHELAILSALMDGSALEQHMEDFYLQTLKQCVVAADPGMAKRLAALEVARLEQQTLE